MKKKNNIILNFSNLFIYFIKVSLTLTALFFHAPACVFLRAAYLYLELCY